jgi:hypothetical protein
MNLFIDRIELTLDGVSPSDARLLSSELPAALETRLVDGGTEAGGASAHDDAPLETALRGRALVQAIAARLADAIGAEAHRASVERDAAAAADTIGETTWP